MVKVSLYDYYSFGYNYYILTNLSSGSTVEKFIKSIAQYIDFIRKLELRVTMTLLEMNGWVEIMNVLKKSNKGTKKTNQINAEIHTQIIEIIKKADLTLDAEMNTKMGYLLSEKRITIEKLTDCISSIFSENTFEYLPQIAKFDFGESGKCIAFDRYTASAFHSLRGTEDVLKYYYTLLIKKDATKSQTWYDFYTDIENETKKGTIDPPPSRELLRDLDSLRLFYRNGTQHPELTYNSDEAQDLLFNCVKTVNQIIKDLKERRLIEECPF